MTSPSRGGGKTEDTDNRLGGGQEAEEGGGGEVSPGPGGEARTRPAKKLHGCDTQYFG